MLNLIKAFTLFLLCIADMTLYASGKHALVAGGSGFLGSHLCERLLNEGYRVTCVDNMMTGKCENIEPLLENPNFCFIQSDICSFTYQGSKIDELYNLACAASPPKYQTDPIHTLKTNIIGVINLLEIATNHRAIFFQASTSEIYGNPDVHPQPESYCGNVNPIGIRACYDEGKRVAETLCFEFHRTHQTAIKVARIFNTYGPRMAANDGRVVSNFINQALDHQPITIFGRGAQTRSFCYVDDLINGIRKLMQTEECFTGPVNIGNPNEMTIQELANEILALTGSSSHLEYRGLPSDDPIRRKPDITLARCSLGWGPAVKLRDGLQKTIDYFKNIRSFEK